MTSTPIATPQPISLPSAPPGSLFSVEWVTDIGVPELNEINTEVLEMLSRFDPITFTASDLGSGSVQYAAQLRETEEFLILKKDLLALIHEMAYQPLTMNVVIRNQYSAEYLSRITTGLKNILSLQLPQLIHHSIDLITETMYEMELPAGDKVKIISLNPLTSETSQIQTADYNQIYLSNDDIGYIQRQCDLNNMVGWDALTDNLLGLYLLNIRPSDLNENIIVRYSNSVLLMKLPTETDEEDNLVTPATPIIYPEIEEVPLYNVTGTTYIKPSQPLTWEDFDRFKSDFVLDLEALEAQDYFCLASNSLQLTIIKEICKLWPIEYIDELKFQETSQITEDFFLRSQDLSEQDKIWDLLVLKSETTEENFEATSWLLNNSYFIQSNKLPYFVVDGKWTAGFDDLENRVKCQYAALMAYVDLTNKNPQLIPFLPSVLVVENLQIMARFATYSEVKEFKERFESYLAQSQIWQVFECTPTSSQGSNKETIDNKVEEEFEKCITRRIKIARQYPFLKPLHVDVYIPSKEDTNTPTIRKFLLVDTGDAGRFVNAGAAPLTLATVTEDDVIKLRGEILPYFEQKCHEQMDLVTYEEVKDMSIPQLLTLIMTDEKVLSVKDKQEKTFHYCFTYDTYSKLPSPINPVNRNPFNEKTLMQGALNQLALNGLYSIAGLPAILKEIPVPPWVPPIVTVKKPSDETEPLIFTNDNNYVVVDVIINDLTVNLFEIVTSDIKTLKWATSKLWNLGFFQTTWSAAYTVILKEPSVCLSKYDAILQNANSSLAAGEQALLYLKKLAETEGETFMDPALTKK
jgi:hypothetical protein